MTAWIIEDAIFMSPVIAICVGVAWLDYRQTRKEQKYRKDGN